jgi:eukaryotic-like serine/threonine-protein kinase
MDQPTWIGRTLSGRYKIEALLGQGGMSAVYKATDPNLKRVVAVKLIHSHLSIDPSFVLRFESEASAVASLRHPNIVQVYDFNNDNGVYYMVLEFIPGETLQDRMRRLSNDGRQLSLEDCLKFTANISDAVGYAHQRGMVHRDIKPANIMLDVHGQAILMDFGIVKILGGDSHTSTGAVVGTARYMSPEIIRGEVADHRSDIYSLGVTLYEMLSGRPPFMADSAMTLMMMHLNDPVPDVRGFRPDIHPEIVSILAKCLEKNREARHPSALELSAELKHALAYLSGQSASIRLQKEPETPTEIIAPEPTPSDRAEPEFATVKETAPKPLPPTPSPASPPPASGATYTTPPASKAGGGSRRSLWIIGAGLAGILCLAATLVLGNFLLNRTGSQQAGEPTQTITAPAPTDTLPPTQAVIAPATETTAPPAIPTETLVAYTPTPEGPYVVITGIGFENNLYVVNYEVHNFPSSPSLHVHMFFNTVPPEQAGSPAAGPWKLTWGVYGDPPFTGYGPANRPANATQMCALVANPNHSVQLGTGNCVELPPY